MIIWTLGWSFMIHSCFRDIKVRDNFPGFSYQTFTKFPFFNCDDCSSQFGLDQALSKHRLCQRSRQCAVKLLQLVHRPGKNVPGHVLTWHGHPLQLGVWIGHRCIDGFWLSIGQFCTRMDKIYGLQSIDGPCEDQRIRCCQIDLGERELLQFPLLSWAEIEFVTDAQTFCVLNKLSMG